ncbi:MAG: DNA polymerase I [Candidatus Omnitrophota bacterium]
MADQQLYLIDATALCYRAFYGLKGLATSYGQPTNAVYGFVIMLHKILKEKKPDYLAVCFDVSRNTFRQKKFTEYKSNRAPMPDDLSSQIPLIKEIVAAYGIPLFEKEGFEADDVLATLAKKAKEKKISTTIVSSDKDILQLVDDNTRVYSPYKDKGVVYGEAEVIARFGLEAARISDVVALMGDAIDNIPGVPGIGEKTALSLVKQFGSLDEVLKRSDEIKSQKIRTAVREYNDRIKLNKELAVLDSGIELDFELDTLKLNNPDYSELFRLFQKLEFKALAEELPVRKTSSPGQEIALITDTAAGDIVKEGTELIMYAPLDSAPVFCVLDKVFSLPQESAKFKEILENPQIKKISHDLKKIKIYLAQRGIVLEGLFFDTMIAGYLLNPSRGGYSLSDLAWDYLGKPLQAIEGNPAEASALIRELKPRLEHELKDKSLDKLFSGIEMPLVGVLAQMELAGIKLDRGVLSELSVDIEKRLIRLIEEIYAASGSQFNINSPKQLREVLFEKLKLPVVKKTKTGASTDEEVLRTLAATHHLPALLLEYRQLTKLKSTYIDALPEMVDARTGRIHTSFNQTGTETGRLSSSNPNLQNIPVKTDIGKNIRRAIIALQPDSCLVSCDYSQVELRILAHLSKDEQLISAFKADKDIHRITASLIYDKDQSEVTEPMRDTAKRVNFGIIYGLSSFGLARDLSISQTEAQNFIDAYFLRYPRVKEYIQEQIAFTRKYGFVTTLSGRRRYIPEINNKNQGIRQFAERQAVNTPIQGSASDLIKLAMVNIQAAFAKERLPATMMMQIHDELVFDIPKKQMPGCVGIIKDKMEHVFELAIPIKVDIKTGQNWLDMQEYV